ncbi:hypothetical protein [Symbioplanes lichenis]|uniref:hypothetical protein n=1 Tax=Symbioplanes lichenis TaxID=1629072 RepID=UPI00273904C6|nr:hypothetical protein [Actinoplanes lichenis]
MRWLTLYLRSRRVPAALAVIAGITVLLWTLWSVFSNTREISPIMVILTVLLLVTVSVMTLSGADDALEKTASLRWPRRRAAHLLVALAVVLGLLFATLLTGARFAPAGLVLRDAAGLLGLTALGAAIVGAARAWFVPLGWTLAVVLYPLEGTVLKELATWQVQVPGNTVAVVTAAVLGAGGLIAYAVAGPPTRA